jgi:hypothetical protein
MRPHHRRVIFLLIGMTVIFLPQARTYVSIPPRHIMISRINDLFLYRNSESVPHAQILNVPVLSETFDISDVHQFSGIRRIHFRFSVRRSEIDDRNTKKNSERKAQDNIISTCLYRYMEPVSVSVHGLRRCRFFQNQYVSFLHSCTQQDLKRIRSVDSNINQIQESNNV